MFQVGAGDSSEGSSMALNLVTSPADLSPSSPNCSYDTDGLPSSPPLASSSPQPPAQPPLSPTSSTLRTVQSTLATVQGLQACLSQMTAPPQPLWPPPMPTMPAVSMPQMPRLNTSSEVESLRILLQQQQQAVQQAQQAQAMFLFHPGEVTEVHINQAVCIQSFLPLQDLQLARAQPCCSKLKCSNLWPRPPTN